MSERLRLAVRWETALALGAVAVVLYGSSVSPQFLKTGNFFYICLDVGEIAIMALPLTLIVITGEIDLSVASTLGLSGVVMAELFKHGWNVYPAMGVALLLGIVLGAFNGFLITKLGLPSLAVTIGTLTFFRGVAQVILPTDTIGGFPNGLANIGVVPISGTQLPWSIAFFAVLAVIVGVVLHLTPLGRSLYAIGTSQEAAFFSGIRVKRIKFWLFVFSGFLSAFAGILWTLRFASARYDSGTGLELQVVTVVLLGGISIFGGRGTILGVVLAVFVLGALSDALTLALVSAQDQQIVIGALLIASVILPNGADLYRRGRLWWQTLAEKRRAKVQVQEGAS